MKLEGIKVLDLSLFLPGPALTQAMADRARDELGAQLPQTEVRILALHFATLLAQHPKENR